MKQIDATGVDLWEDDAEILCSVHLEVLLVLSVLRDTRPGALRWCAHNAEDAYELVFVCCAGEEGAACVHLCHDAAGGPDVDASVVGAGAEEDVWGSVPERYDFIGEGVDWNAKSTSETEVSKLEHALVVYEEVLGLQIAVEDSVCVAEVNAFEELVHEGFDGYGVQSSAIALCVHVLLEIFVHVVEDEHEFVFGVDDIMEADDILVLQLFHQ